jgi:hypothetical protein
MTAPRPKTTTDWAYLSIESLDIFLTAAKRGTEAEQAVLFDLVSIAQGLVEKSGSEGAQKLLAETMKDVEQKLQPKYLAKLRSPSKWLAGLVSSA